MNNKYNHVEDRWKLKDISISDKERMKNTVKIVPKDVSTVADIGCGNGFFVNNLSKITRIKKIVGIDINPIALKHVKTTKKIGNIAEIPLKTNSYDLVTSLEVIEHLDVNDYKKALQELTRVSKKYILVSVPFEEDIESNFIKCPSCKTQYNPNSHKRTFDEATMLGLFKDSGYECVNLILEGENYHYLFLSRLLLICRRKNFKRFRYDKICPICGFKIDTRSPRITRKKFNDNSKFSIIKKIWPRVRKYKWIIALYEKF